MHSGIEVRAPVVGAGCQKNGSRFERDVVTTRQKAAVPLLDRLDTAPQQSGTVELRLSAHTTQQLLAANSVGKAGMVV